MLTCVLWVLKNIDKALLKLWWSEMSLQRLQVLLEILRISISCFQYKVGHLTQLFRDISTCL